jgi:hypothetical protein
MPGARQNDMLFIGQSNRVNILACVNGGSMQKTFAALALLSLSLLFPASNANSCGDKFLVIGRGIRYERAHAAAHPASILIYATGQEAAGDLQSMLKMAGHKVQVATEEKQLYSSLNSNRYDVVLLKIDDTAAQEAKIIATPYKPAVLPVIYKSKGNEIDSAAAEYPCVLKYKEKNANAIAVIDQVMEERSKGKPMVCKWSK